MNNIRMLLTVILLVPVFSHASSGDADITIVIDLANPADISREVTGAGSAKVHVLNMAPALRGDYVLLVDYSHVELNPFDRPDFSKAEDVEMDKVVKEAVDNNKGNPLTPTQKARLTLQPVCDALIKEAKDFSSIINPGDVHDGILKLRAAIADAQGTCSEANLEMADSLIDKTRDVQNVSLKEDTVVTVTVVAPGQETSIEVTSRGPQWISHFGIGFIRNKDELYHSIATGSEAGNFVIGKQQDRDKWDYSAMAMFTYPVSNISNNIQFGLTGGLGSGDKALSALFGVSFIIRENLILTGGVVLREASVLKGQYQAGQTVAQSIDSAVLMDTTYKSAFGVVFGYRFGD